MTLPRIGSALERARTRRPITWLTIVGVILLPVLVGGLLVVALYNPTERLDRMSAAIVNDDKPVQVDGKTVPLGRQLTAGLVKGSDTVPSNLDWTISNASDAAAGLADGTYTAVITIPKDFSASATSVSDGATAKQATIEVQTAADARVVDDAITSTITQTAASVFGQALSKNYLENVFVGFTTLGSKLGDAADGATQLGSGAHAAADGATQLSTGADGLASGAGSLAGGLTTIAGKTRDAASGAGQLAAGERRRRRRSTRPPRRAAPRQSPATPGASPRRSADSPPSAPQPAAARRSAGSSPARPQRQGRRPPLPSPQPRQPAPRRAGRRGRRPPCPAQRTA